MEDDQKWPTTFSKDGQIFGHKEHNQMALMTSDEFTMTVILCAYNTAMLVYPRR